MRKLNDGEVTLDAIDIAQLRGLSDEELRKLLGLAQDASRYLDLARRTQAEFDNYQKRAEKQRQDEAKYAIVPLVRELVGSVDNLARARASAEKNKDFEPLFKGVEMTHQSLLQSLAKFGAQPIDAKGEAFNPECHEAVMTGSDPSQADGVVLDCFEQGWRLKDRVIRAAKVRVNKLEEAVGEPKAKSNEDNAAESGK